MQQALEFTNLFTAAATLVFAALLLRELLQLKLGVPRVGLLLIAFFVALALDRVAAPDPLLGYDQRLDAATDILLILLLAVLLAFSRKLARASLATISDARLRAAEYARARRDYSRLVAHRLANPLTAIIGAAHTLERPDLDDETRAMLVRTILDAAERTQQVSLAPERIGPEEHELDAMPRLDRRRT